MTTREVLETAAAYIKEAIDQLPTDPSLPRTWDTLDAVDTDVERATGDYAGMCREFARSGLCESGWFQWLKDESYGGWVGLPVDRTKHVTNIRENQ